MSSSSSSHLPALPTETHAHILSYCDDQTLGRACLVSPAFLELASPLLYTHVAITGFDQLVKLFYDDVSPMLWQTTSLRSSPSVRSSRPDALLSLHPGLHPLHQTRTSSAPHLDRFLSLDQRRTFTFVGKAELSYSIAFKRTLTRTRSSCSFPIHVDTLTARFHDDDDYTRKLISSFLGLFSPKAVALAHSPPMNMFKGIDLNDAADWTALQSLTVSGLFWEDGLNRTAWFGRLKDRSLTIVVEMPPPKAMYPTEVRLRSAILSEDLVRDWPQLKEVVFKVETEAEKQSLIGEWRTKAYPRPLWSQARRDRQAAMIRYVVG